MIIERIKLHNFKIFRNTEVSFSQPTETKYIALITGDMGSGKSILIEAIYWCLYGDQADKGPHLLNRESANNLQRDNIVEVSVSLDFRGSLGRFSLKRIAKFTKEGNHIIQSDTRENQSVLEIRLIEQDNCLLYKDAEDFIQNIIPKALIPYFITDGEYLSRISHFNLETLDTQTVDDDIKLIRKRISEITEILQVMSVYETKIKRAAKLSLQCLSAMDDFENQILDQLSPIERDPRDPSFYLKGIVPDTLIKSIFPKGHKLTFREGNLGVLSAGMKAFVTMKYLLTKNADLGFLFPLIINEPFSFLSSNLIELALSFIDQTMKGQQVLLLTSSLWFDETPSIIGDKFNIENDPSEGSIFQKV